MKIEEKKFKGYYVKKAITRDEVEKMRETWQEMQWHPDGDIDRYLSMIAARKEIVRPYIISVFFGNEIKTILVGRVEDIPFPIKMGYSIVYKPFVRSITFGYGGILGKETKEICQLIITQLDNALKRKEGDIVYFQAVNEESPFYEIFKEIPRGLFRKQASLLKSHWKLEFLGTFDDYFRNLSKQTRKRLKREENRIDREFGQHMALKYYHSKDEIDIIMKDQEFIARKTYHRGLDVGFVYNSRTRERYLSALERGLCRSYILYINREPVAFLDGLEYGGTFYGGTTGYDPKYKQYHVGTYLLIKIFEHLTKNGNVKAMDFGLGDAEYKRIYCNESWKEADVFMFAPTLKGIWIYSIRICFELLGALGRKTFEVIGIEGKMKRLWRNLLTEKRKNIV